MALLDRHIAFIESLRAAGMSVSLAEDLDSVQAISMLGLNDREALRAGLAATVLKRQNQRANFDAIFDLFFPAMLGAGVAAEACDEPDADEGAPPSNDERANDLRDRITEALLTQDDQAQQALAVQGVEQFGSMPGRGPGMSAWSSYNTLQRLNPDILILRLANALRAGVNGNEGRSDDLAMLTATNRVEGFRRRVESDVRRRIAEEKTPEYVAQTQVRPSIDQIPFTSARKSDIDEMRREIYPLARRLATRLAKEQHARRRGPLDFRRTVRASISTGGVPLTTYHKPKRPHRTELVVLCDVSGSVANFAQFTLLLVYALREQFGKVRAFTFVDDVHEVTGEFEPGADPAEILMRLAESAKQASLWGRTNYGRAFTQFQAKYADALGPKSSLLILGDARSNYSDPGLTPLREMVDAARHAWWLNPEHVRQWGSGDSAAPDYVGLVPMVECRNLTQLTEFVHDLV